MAGNDEQLPEAQPAANAEDSVLRSSVRSGLKREFAFAIQSQAKLPPSLGRFRTRSAPYPTPITTTAARTLSSKKLKKPIGDEHKKEIRAQSGFPLESTNKLTMSCAVDRSDQGSFVRLSDDSGNRVGVSTENPTLFDNSNKKLKDKSLKSNNLKVKMSRKFIKPTTVPSDVGELFATRLLEGLQVTCKVTEEKQFGFQGVIRNDGILCLCSSCKGSNAYSLPQFKEHVGCCLRKTALDCIYFRNGKSLRDLLEVCSTVVSVDVLEPTIRKELQGSEDLSFEEQKDHQEFQSLCVGTDSSTDRLLDTSIIASTSGSSHQKTGNAKITKKDFGLHKLVFSDILPQGTEVAYYVKGEKFLEGHIKDSGIYCHCCKRVISPSQFEIHAGQGKRRKPYNYIYMSNGVSLHELSVSLSKDRKIPTNENDDVCTYCELGDGTLIRCASCPRAFHEKCLKWSRVSNEAYCCEICTRMHKREKFVERNANAIAAGRDLNVDVIDQVLRQCIHIVNLHDTSVGGCVLCRSQDFSNAGFNPNTIIICDQCEKEFHVRCLKDHNIADLKELPIGKWFCSKDCNDIDDTLQKLLLNGVERLPSTDLDFLNTKLEKKGSRIFHDHDVTWRLLSGKTVTKESQLLIDEVDSIFHESFTPILESRTKRDLIPLMLKGEDSEYHNFSGMYCVVLTVGSLVVSAATLRIFGCEVAELPLAATRKESEGQGYFQILFSCIERLLFSLKVKHFVLPATHEVEAFWTKKFGFATITSDLLNEFTKGKQLMMFQGASILHKPILD